MTGADAYATKLVTVPRLVEVCRATALALVVALAALPFASPADAQGQGAHEHANIAAHCPLAPCGTLAALATVTKTGRPVPPPPLRSPRSTAKTTRFTCPVPRADSRFGPATPSQLCVFRL